MTTIENIKNLTSKIEYLESKMGRAKNKGLKKLQRHLLFFAEN